MSSNNVPSPRTQVRATGGGPSNSPPVTVLADEDEHSSQRRKCSHCRETGHNKRTCPQLADKDASNEAYTAGTGHRAVGGNSSCRTEAGRRLHNGRTRSRENIAMARRRSIEQQWTVLPPPAGVELVHYKDLKARLFDSRAHQHIQDLKERMRLLGMNSCSTVGDAFTALIGPSLVEQTRWINLSRRLRLGAGGIATIPVTLAEVKMWFAQTMMYSMCPFTTQVSNELLRLWIAAKSPIPDAANRRVSLLPESRWREINRNIRAIDPATSQSNSRGFCR